MRASFRTPIRSPHNSEARPRGPEPRAAPPPLLPQPRGAFRQTPARPPFGTICFLQASTKASAHAHPFGKATWGKGWNEGGSSSWSPNAVPLRGHEHLLCSLIPAFHAARLPKRSSLPSGAGRDRAGHRAWGGCQRNRLRPLSLRQRHWRPVRPSAGCELPPWPQPRGEKARTGTRGGGFRRPPAYPAGARGAEAGRWAVGRGLRGSHAPRGDWRREVGLGP